MRRELFRGIVSALVLIVALGCFLNPFFSDAANTLCYTQIDNSTLRRQYPTGGVFDFTGGMPYIYRLPAYDGRGEEWQVSFGTATPLREGTFLCLRVNPIRGVLRWAEVEYAALPGAVQGRYPAPSGAQG